MFERNRFDVVTEAIALRQDKALDRFDEVNRTLSTEPGPPTPTANQLAQQRLARQAAVRPWRAPTIAEALGVPANLRAVMLISNMMGVFTLEAFRNGQRVSDEQRPRLTVRPNPFTTARDYFRETGWSMATRGENWQWVGARDAEGAALSLIPVPSQEVRTEGDWISPRVFWRNSPKTADMMAVFLTKELGATRGKGPFQYCGAAISAAVESQEWAANFYADGGNPNVHMHSEVELTEDEATALRSQWVNTPPNMPQITTGPLTVDTIGGTNEGSAQALDSRNFNAGEAARMFGIPGPLLEFARAGSSLTYQNVVTLMDQFLKQCLIPDYLRPVEQMLTDLLPRNWVTRFDVDSILRADMKTRFEVYKIGLDSGVYPDPTIPQQNEGILPGSPENAPVPLSPPSAIPSGLPTPAFMGGWRCDNCGKMLAQQRGKGTVIKCRCGILAVA